MSNDHNSKPRTFTFNPTISFDGIAVIVACVTCAMWFGTLSQTVRNHTEQLQHHGQILETLSESQRLQAQNIAILTTLVNERTKGTK
jgi:hypothetical protein